MYKLTILLLLTWNITIFGQSTSPPQKIADFLPSGYMIFEQVNGDLDKDGRSDVVLFIKGTDLEHVVLNDYDKKVDRNRRGIIILFNKNDHYELVLKNYDCFMSENEEGGVYYPPELFLEIGKGNLYVRYNHGRYGYWKYTFRYQDSDFVLIGYDATSGGAIINNITSINFLTKKKQINVNVSEDEEEEIFAETWKSIKIDQLIKLSEIKDFYELDMSVY